MRKCPYQIENDDGSASMCIANDHCRCDEQAEYSPEYTLSLIDECNKLREREEAIVKATIERCAVTAMNSCFVPPDGGSPSAEAVAACDMAYSRISQLSVKDILESVK